MIAESVLTSLGAPCMHRFDGEELHAAGLQAARQGRTDEAIVLLSDLLAADPRHAQARLNLGVALAQARRHEEAVEQFETTASLAPAYADAHLNLAKSHAGRQQHRSAVAAFRRALAIAPTSVEALSGIGLSLTHLGEASAATVYLQQAVRLEPTFAGAWSNLGFALAVLGRYDDADAAFDAALRLDPSLPEALVNRGNALKERGRLAEAIACYDLAIALNRDAGSARWNRSLALLQQGDFRRGWPAYESRWDRQSAGPRDVSLAGGRPEPRWDGSSPAGQTIVVCAEQGLGDTVMFVRYAGHLKQAGATVWMESPAPLANVLKSCPWVDRVIPERTALGAPPLSAAEGRADAFIPCMSLPALFSTTGKTIPAEVPYLHPDPDRVAHFRRRLAGTAGKAGPREVAPRRLTVGIVWQGNPHHPWDRHRSLALRLLWPLAAAPGVRLVSLQRGPGHEQLRDCPFALHDLLAETSTDHRSEADAVADLTAAIAAVDLLVTVDTLPAHLAGAIGQRVWVLLSTMVDWRWMCDRPDSPWYPSMRLFRQSRRDDWASVVSDVVRSLGDLQRDQACQEQDQTSLREVP